MKGETINIVDNLIQAISILNKTDEYLESLTDRLSECDSIICDYYHFIENTDINEINLQELFTNMKDVFLKRRIIKNNMTLKDNYRNLVGKLNNNTNREFLIQSMKNVSSKIETKCQYHNRILKNEQIEVLKNKIEIKPKRGRPKKVEVS